MDVGFITISLAQDPFELWPQLRLEEDASHAYYMGVELARAQIAWQLGKRYVQDQLLGWGCAVDAVAEDVTKLKEAGTTLQAKQQQKKAKKKRS